MRSSLPRVLSYPTVHPYIDRLDGYACRSVHRDHDRTTQARLYDPDWIRDHAHGWDVAHLHMGFEGADAGLVADVVEAHQRAGVRIVWTAHELHDPATPPEAADDGALRVVADAADAVLTLTAGAAEEVRERFDRFAKVVPHGPVIQERTASRMRRQRRIRPRIAEAEPRVLLHAESLAPDLDWRTVVDVGVAGALPGLLDVGVHRDEAAEVRRLTASAPTVLVSAHDPLCLARVAARVAACDVLVIPRVWGSHSGLLEVALDLGVPVVVGDVGHLREQGATTAVPVSGGRLSAEELPAAVSAALAAAHRPVSWCDRERALWEFRTVHEHLYRRLSQPVMAPALVARRRSIDLTEVTAGAAREPAVGR